MHPFETSRSLSAALSLLSQRARKRGLGLGLGLGLLALGANSFAAPVFVPADQPTGWVSRPAVSSSKVTSGSQVIFRPDYKNGLWNGTIRAYNLSATGAVLATSPWTTSGVITDTATKLGAMDWSGTASTSRKILTRNTSGTQVAFRASGASAVDASQLTLLGGATNGPILVNFLRGDRSNEDPNGTDLRARTAVQGDTLHAPLTYWKYANGDQRLFAGGNDGMLHVFNAADGSEVFAYVPSMLMATLPKLAVSPYVHTPYVDGGITVADVMLSSQKTLLVGALGGGGKGLFMLDVTSSTPPASETALVTAGPIKWEISSATSSFTNLGYTYATPKFGRLNSSGTAVVIVGNGYMSSSGKATLFIINADTGALIREIDTSASGGTGSAASPNGLSTPTLVDANGDGKVDYAYAGDLDGNLWKFDLTSASAASYTATKLMTTDNARAITTAPVVAPHPLSGRLVLFGTGSTLNVDDLDDLTVHYVYGAWDGAPVANTAWNDQDVTKVVSGAQQLRTTTTFAADWGTDKGWRLELPPGERVVGEGQFLSDSRFHFVATNPTVAAASDLVGAGENWLMEVDYRTGASPGSPVFDISGNGSVGVEDNLSGAVVAGKLMGAGVSSQAVLADSSATGLTYFNQQSDIDYSPPTASADTGVSGGHFDVDFFNMSTTTSTKKGKTTTTTAFALVKHTHEWDDKYDVTGVNMLNPSDATFKLSSKLATTTKFKVLLMNQYLNPASKVSVGGAAYVSVKDFGTQATATLALGPTYALASGVSGATAIGTLVWNLPTDAFRSKDWWGDGGTVRSGLIPTTPTCVKSINADGTPASGGRNGLYGERHDGALTFQLIKDTTPSTSLEMNYAAGGAKYGWRVKAADFSTYVLAEYSTYWHHPNDLCYGASGWVANAPEDNVGAAVATSTKAAGSSDPTDGTFGGVGGAVGTTLTSSVTTATTNVVTITLTYSDGKKATIVYTDNGNGTETVKTTAVDGTVTTVTRSAGGTLATAPAQALVGSRRINWREVMRP